MSLHRAALRRCSVRQNQVVVRYLSERDHPVLRELIEEFESHIGRPRGDLEERLRQAPEDTGTLRPLAVAVLNSCFPTQARHAVEPLRARQAVFHAAVDRRAPQAVIDAVAASLRVSAAALDESLFADLPSQRLIQSPGQPLSPARLELMCNLAIQQGLLRRATEVTIELEGAARAVVRQARLRGLICSVSPTTGPVRLVVSGPLSLFRKTTIYGRALAELVPLLAWCRRFHLLAQCKLHGGSAVYRLATGDPILPAAEPRRYDSALEQRFARDFIRLTADWDLVREPEPVAHAGGLLFPDFAIVHRCDPARRWLLEIVGCWTRDYLERKFAALRTAELRRLIVCIDDRRGCDDAVLPSASRVVRFRRRVAAARVLEIIEG